MGKRLVLGHHAAGHVGRVRQLGAVHEIVHRRTARRDVREVKSPVALVTVAWRTKCRTSAKSPLEPSPPGWFPYLDCRIRRFPLAERTITGTARVLVQAELSYPSHWA